MVFFFGANYNGGFFSFFFFSFFSVCFMVQCVRKGEDLGGINPTLPPFQSPISPPSPLASLPFPSSLWLPFYLSLLLTCCHHWPHFLPFFLLFMYSRPKPTNSQILQNTQAFFAFLLFLFQILLLLLLLSSFIFFFSCCFWCSSRSCFCCCSQLLLFFVSFGSFCCWLVVLWHQLNKRSLGAFVCSNPCMHACSSSRTP